MKRPEPQETEEELIERLLDGGDELSTSLDKAQPGLTSDDYYFDSYAHYGIHQEMIKDSVRTDAYMKAICGNSHLFEGKTVLDVGCGTGILSLFAAEAGAAKVYAADCSRIVDQAHQIVSDNGFSDTIEVIEGRVEDIELPGVGDGVDIIISEWMGYFLLYESMLDSVIVARDRWLKPGGIIMPDRAVLKVCGIEDEGQRHQNIEYWDDVYGFDMGCMKPIVQAEPLVEDVALDQIVTSEEVVFQIDINKVARPELSFAAPFALRATARDRCSALAFSFDVIFSHGSETVILPTGPRTKSTHWKQASLFLDRPIELEPGDVLDGTLACRPSEGNHRDLDLGVEIGLRDTATIQTARFRMR